MIQSISNIASKASIAVAFMIVALSLTAGTSANGDEFDRIDNRAQKIQKKSRLLTKEIVHFRHTAQYASLVNATTHLHDAAGHVHQVAHFANNLDHLQSDLADLDCHLHQLQELFAATEDATSRGQGHVHGNTGYAKSLLRSIETNIDLLRKDVRKIQSRAIPQHQVLRASTPAAHYDHGHRDARNYSVPQARERQYQRPVYQQPPCPQQRRQGNGFSFSIGGGSSRIQLNF